MPRHDDYDDYDDRPARSSLPFPAGVKAAGIIWISFGVLGLLNSVLSFVINAGAAAGAQGQGGPPQGNVCGVGCGVLFALVFLMVGIQTLKGTAKGTLANGIGSIIFGLLYAGLAVLTMVLVTQIAGGAGVVMFILAGLVGVLALALLVAGFLAIAGREAYAEWRAANGMGPRLRPRTPEEEDYDDRPRRPRRDRDEDDER